jgi:hypothetical protein
MGQGIDEPLIRRFTLYLVMANVLKRLAGITAMAAIASIFAGVSLDAKAQDSSVHTIGGVGYEVPKGWSVNESSGVAVLTGPVPPQYQPCILAIDPTVRPQGEAAVQLEAIVNGAFGAKFGVYHGEGGADLKADQYQGVSVTGWPYVDLLGQLGRSNFHVRALLARFNDRAVAVLGLFNAVDCLGSYYVRDNDTFLMVFHSLRLPGFERTSPELAKRLLGSWQRVSGGAGVSVTYAANGQFDDGAVKANYYLGGNGMIYDIASHFVGNGTYRIDGDRLTMNGHGASRTMLISIVRRPRANRPGEYEEFLRRVEAVDNQVWGFARTGHYVISYQRTP